MKGYGSQARPFSRTLMAEYTTSTTPNQMMNLHEPPKRATASAMRSPKVDFSSISSLGLRWARSWMSRCEGMDLASEHGEHVEAGEGFALDQHGDVLAIELQADGLFHRHGVGLMRRLIDHRGEAEDAAVDGFVDQDFLLVFVVGGDADAAGHEDVGGVRDLSDFEDALADGELADVDLCGEDGQFFLVQEFKERDVSELVGIAGHGFSLSS